MNLMRARSAASIREALRKRRGNPKYQSQMKRGLNTDTKVQGANEFGK